MADGRLHARCDFSVGLSDLENMLIENLSFRLERLRIKSKTEHHDILRIASFDMEGGRIEPLRQSALLETSALQGLELFVERDTNILPPSSDRINARYSAPESIRRLVSFIPSAIRDGWVQERPLSLLRKR